MSMYLSLHQLGIQINDRGVNRTLIHDLSLELAQGEIGCLMGQSGSGKSTLLRAIAGFESLSSGTITMHGKLIATPTFSVSPEDRRIGLMFQDYALFPHLTAEKNIAFGLNRLDRSTRTARVEEMLELVGMQHLGKRFAHELSGGQQQRIALARSLAPAPALLLLDEPFSNLDLNLRASLAQQVRDILKKTHCTALMVTHSLDEAKAVGDRIGEIRDGYFTGWSPTGA
jgi:iron(III) transport system ATP-binding protein